MDEKIKNNCSYNLPGAFWKSFQVFTILTFIGLSTFFSSCNKVFKKELTLAVSANARFAIEKVAESYHLKGNEKPVVISGSSGKLSAQIVHGAPFDIFFSADMKYPQYLFEKGIAKQKPEVYARGKLVVFSAIDTLDLNDSIFLRPYIINIAIANAETAPYGKAAIDYLKNTSLYSNIQDKLVYGESISQTNEFIISGAADIGITALSVMKSDQMKEYKNWRELDINMYSSIHQGMVIIEDNEEALKFTEYLFSEEGRQILRDFGYFSPDESI